MESTHSINSHRQLLSRHEELYGASDETIVVRAPGRAEIIGNHTDYNEGFTLSANIDNSLTVAARARDDAMVRIYSDTFDAEPIEFSIESADTLWQEKIATDSVHSWVNYCKGVIWSYLKEGYTVRGFDANLSSTIPTGGGMSSSAAFETAISRIIANFSNLDISNETQVHLCLQAENTYVGVPCGTLDQATVGLSEQWLFIDHRPSADAPFTYRHIQQDIASAGLRLVIGYDPHSKHSLVDGKYASRRQACMNSLPVFSNLLNRTIQSLREVTPEEFSDIQPTLVYELSSTDIDYVHHVIDENARTLAAIQYLEEGELEKFGEQMTASGRSSLDLYRLDEDTPELRELYNFISSNAEPLGALGIRNMGGGFNATTLALVHTDATDNYMAAVSAYYHEKFGRDYMFTTFHPSQSARVL